MAVAAYASLLSLSHVLENIQHPARRTRLHLDSNQLQTLQQKVQFLLEFLEVDSGRISLEMEDLARQIAILADEAEDVIDLHVVYQLGEGCRDESQDMAALSSFYQDIHKVIQKIDSIMNELGMIQEDCTHVSKQQPAVSVPDSSSTAFTSSGKSSTMVGFDEHLVRVMDELTRNEPDLQIIPITGMGGIDDEIKASELIKLWVAEGFLKPSRAKTLEEVAEEYLRNLIDRNLILVHKWNYGGKKAKTCRIHDLLRDLCLRQSQKECLICVPKAQRIDFFEPRWEICLCFLCSSQLDEDQRMDLPEVQVTSQSTSLASLSVCDGCRIMYPNLVRLRLLRVKAYVDDMEFLHPTKLCYLKTEFESPSTISLLWNLQTLTLSLSSGVLPSEIWDMPQLRHLIGSGDIVLPHPIVTQDSVIMENLQTLADFRDFRCTIDVLDRLPNLKKLGIVYIKKGSGCLENLAYLQKLESLFLLEENVSLLANITFPTSLKKLSLSNCCIPWEEMTIFGSVLPNLEKLTLYYNAFTGPEWSPVDGQFPRLKVLIIWYNDLERWRAESIHFPNLERLHLYNMFCLEEIPLGIGDIPTLLSIHLEDCSDSSVNSAKQILEEQQTNSVDKAEES
ncbi:putative late blight resistance protein homolog R1A-3 [Sesamum indicum]|uniref:Late blight resistance protein homolog R1A-3 n=1 Tax=Sesamum indicum TaxID=4182 RepID=A0A8M8UMP7_SESIN|nr:putative late blight resistance protein homolog R1A-3 [Sesamum indicum]